VTGVYFYAGFSIDDNGTFHGPSDEFIQTHTAPFRALGLTVGVAMGTSQTAIESGIASKGVAAAAKVASRNNLTSIMVDYEPATNISKSHSESYAKFISDLSSSLHAHGLQCGMCISSWGILTTFDLYASTGVDQMMSMASTYYGKDVSAVEGWVEKEIAQNVSLSQLHVGIGSTNSVFQKWNYNWTEDRFNTVMSFLKGKGVRGVDLWRTDIDTLNATNGTAQWIYDGLEAFLQDDEA